MAHIQIKQSIPLLPAVDIKATIAFYEDLGFVNTYANQEQSDSYQNKKRSGSYAVMDNSFFAFHLYTYKKLPVPTPTNAYLYSVENVDDLYNLFMDHYKSIHGKVPPRNGLGRVGVPKTLDADRRFTVTDPNGNYFIFAQVHSEEDHQVKTHLERVYWTSHTLTYSRETPLDAIRMLEGAMDRTKNLNQESPNSVFQSFVLLMDSYALLDNPEKAREYYGKASDWFEKIESDETDYLNDAIQQFQSFDI